MHDEILNNSAVSIFTHTEGEVITQLSAKVLESKPNFSRSSVSLSDDVDFRLMASVVLYMQLVQSSFGCFGRHGSTPRAFSTAAWWILYDNESFRNDWRR
jgi:hypothetical protein